MRFISIIFIALLASLSQAQDIETASDTLRVSVYDSEPFVSSDDTGKVSGLDIDIIEEIAKRSNWELEFVFVEQFSDLIPSVENEESDIAISSITITPEREMGVDFSQPYMHTGLGIMVTDDQDISISESIGSWIQMRIPLFMSLITICFLFVIVLLVFGVLLYITDEQRKKDSSDDDGLTISEVIKGSLNSTWLAFTTGSTIGYGDVYPKNAPARFVAVLCFFSVAILVSSLTASITSFNVIQKINTGIQGADDLSGTLVATVSGTTSVDAAISYGASVKKYNNIDQAIAAMILGNVDAVVYDEPRLRFFTNGQGRGKVRLVDSVFESQDYGIAFVSNSEYIEAANIALLSMQQDGTLAKIEGKYLGLK